MQLVRVPVFRISVVNETFSACEELEFPTASEARTAAIKGALAIGSEEVVNGKEFFGAEVKIEKGDELLRRFVVSIGASPIAPNK